MLVQVLWNLLAAGMWFLALIGHPWCVFLAVGFNLLGVAAVLADCTRREEESE